MSDELLDRLEEVVREHWRELCAKHPDMAKVKALAEQAKQLRAAIKKGVAA